MNNLFDKIRYKLYRLKVNLPIYKFNNNKEYNRKFFEKHLTNNIDIVNKMHGTNILILAPHVDDDIIGCGGAILAYLKNKCNIYIAYLTNGNKNGDSTIRMKEAKKVASVLSIPESNLHFLNADDKNLINSFIDDKIESILRQNNIDTIFLPVVLDTHIDHMATTFKLINIYEKNPNMFKNIHNIYLYESQSPITYKYCNTLLDITSTLKTKMEILKIYKSQKVNLKFLVQLYKINGNSIGEKKYAECYIKTNMIDYYNFYKAYLGNITQLIEDCHELIPFNSAKSFLPSYKNSLEKKNVLSKLR